MCLEREDLDRALVVFDSIQIARLKASPSPLIEQYSLAAAVAGVLGPGKRLVYQAHRVRVAPTGQEYERLPSGNETGDRPVWDAGGVLSGRGLMPVRSLAVRHRLSRPSFQQVLGPGRPLPVSRTHVEISRREQELLVGLVGEDPRPRHIEHQLRTARVILVEKIKRRVEVAVPGLISVDRKRLAARFDQRVHRAGPDADRIFAGLLAQCECGGVVVGQ